MGVYISSCATVENNHIEALAMHICDYLLATFTSDVFLVVFTTYLHCSKMYITEVRALFPNPRYEWQIEFPEKRRLFRFTLSLSLSLTEPQWDRCILRTISKRR